MKEKIAFPQLVELLAEKASTTERMSELFLQELFAVVTQELAEGKSVTIKGLGTFKTTKVESRKDVVFTPDKDLAETVNAPFSQFVPVELCDEVTDDMLSEIDSSMELPAKNENVATKPVLSEENTEDVGTSSSEDITVDEGTRSALSEESAQDADKATALSTPSHDEEHQDTESRNARKWLIAAAAAAAIIAVWYFYTHRDKDHNDKAIETTQVAKSDSTDVKNAKTQPIVTDTIGNGNVLFTMAKKHYGDQAFWVYIARENQSQYPDYRKIKSGTVLVIPPAEKYGINSDSKQSIKHAYAEALKLSKEVKAADQNATSLDSTSIISSKKVTTTKQLQRKSNSRKHYRHYRSSRNKHHHR
ncbi:MAG: HU family DNA-binding protein [Muribaculaceae bacterium]|nr:HU family DNA-binding protein [Muribaculaceae bacterium]MBR5171424.1 HU family DNA-binding protein [Muribaculaceae bacterium]